MANLSARKPIYITSGPSQTIEEFETLFLDQLKKFKEEGVSNMLWLAQNWSKTSVRSRSISAARIYSVIKRVDFEKLMTLNAQWVERFFTDLPEACQKVLIPTVYQEDIPEELRTELASRFASLRGLTGLDAHKVKRLLRLLPLSALRRGYLPNIPD